MAVILMIFVLVVVERHRYLFAIKRIDSLASSFDFEEILRSRQANPQFKTLIVKFPQLFLDFSLGLKNHLPMRLSGILFFFILSMSFSRLASAYPDFIGYGYSSCLLCHFNGHGNGPLTDYGRGVFASEIVSKGYMDSKTTDDELSQSSGFLGKKPLPWWFRPGFKYRGLWFQSNPGSEQTMKKLIHMQADASLALLFDQDQKYAMVMSYGYYPVPANLKNDPNKPTEFLSREHYFRWMKNDNLTLFAGLMDKAYGIRIVDHTAYSRGKVGVAQNDQTYGMMAMYRKEPWEFTPHLFIGNLAQNSDQRQKGFSFMAERDIHQYFRLGGSFMMSENEYVNWTRMAAHSKYGYGKGNSLLTEAGLIMNKPKSGSGKTGGYGLAQSMALIKRGYFFLSQIEYYNQTLSTKSPDNLKWTFGLLAFPYLKTEFRLTVVNGRDLSDESVVGDSWTIQTQLHFSL